MCKRFLIAAVAIVLTLIASTLFAQCGCGVPAYTAPAVSYSAYYAPAVTYTAAYEPVAAYYPAPYVANYTPVTTYYTPYTTYSTPYAAYSPAYVVGRPYAAYGASVFGAPRVYVQGEPVRNVVRALTW
jgi:hypothetical protein